MDLRNIAIIAHVDHGKTTLIDRLLAQSGALRANRGVNERAMDWNDLERERGITILAKVTSVVWDGIRVNIVDTPGHADFGGEVERILNMVDGAVLLVDAAEGPMPQTKFVLAKALEMGLEPIVAINKIDKPDERHEEVIDEVFDLFVALGANDDQLDFPLLYGSAKEGWMAADPEGPRDGMAPLFERVIGKVPAPITDSGAFAMLATTIESDPYLGRILTGRIRSGRAVHNMLIKALDRDGHAIEQGRIAKVLAFRGLERQPVEAGEAGDIVAIAGLKTASVADTVCAPEIEVPITAQPIDPPTLAMTLRINDGPLAGKAGNKVQSRVIRDRLFREAEGNVALRVSATAEADAFEVAGRGELQLAIVIETMRREGFELTVGRPRVVMRRDDGSGKLFEPLEDVTVDVDEPYSGMVVRKLCERRATLVEMKPSGAGRRRLVFHAPTRGLIGYHGALMADTSGTGVMNRVFHGFAPHLGAIPARRTGVLISTGQGTAAAYALWNLEDRGALFIEPGAQVYTGMIVGEHSRGNDLEVNVLKGRKLTNMRASGKDDAVVLTPPVAMTLERALSFIADDELVEVTPTSIRLRKAILDPHERKRSKTGKSLRAC